MSTEPINQPTGHFETTTWTPISKPSYELLEQLLRVSTPGQLATLLQIACTNLAKETASEVAKRKLRQAAKHFGHVTMNWMPEDLGAGRVAAKQEAGQ